MPDQPNILLITSDQQHPDTLGFLNPKIKTPNFDRMAKRGTNFTRAYTTTPVCTPARATIITGQYPSTHGAWTIGVNMDEAKPTVGDEFRKHGYRSTLVGKAHFTGLKSDPDGPGGVSYEAQPTLRNLDFWRTFNDTHTPWYGFDHVELARMHGDESHTGQHYAIWMEEKGLTDWADYFDTVEGGPGPKAPKPAKGPAYGWRENGHWELPEDLHYTTWTAERTIANIEEDVKAGRPFFMWSSFHDPHPPYVVPEPWASMYDPADMPIGELDPRELETMCDFVKRTQSESPDYSDFQDEGGFGMHGQQSQLHDPDMLREAMAIYYGMVSFMDDQIGRILDKLDELGITDNTLVVFTTDHGHFLGQHGLVAKAFMYEDNVRLPFLVQWPGKVPAGQSSDAIQGLVDLAPTFLSACGIDIPGRMQGVDQLPVWTGQTDRIRDNILIEHRHQAKTYNIRSLVNQRYKLTVYKDHDFGELFDLREDPGELFNRWDDPDYQSIKMQLMHEMLDAEMQREPTERPRVFHA